MDGLYFFVSPVSESVKVAMCQRDGGTGDGVEVKLGSNGSVRMGAKWTVGQEVTLDSVRVPSPPIQEPSDLRAEAALWYLETKPVADDDAAELSPERRDEFLRRLRSLGYLE